MAIPPFTGHDLHNGAGGPERPAETGARVANALADAISEGPQATRNCARSFTAREITLGLSFLGTILEIAAASSKALAVVQREREKLTSGR